MVSTGIVKYCKRAEFAEALQKPQTNLNAKKENEYDEMELCAA